MLASPSTAPCRSQQGQETLAWGCLQKLGSRTEAEATVVPGPKLHEETPAKRGTEFCTVSWESLTTSTSRVLAERQSAGCDAAGQGRASLDTKKPPLYPKGLVSRAAPPQVTMRSGTKPPLCCQSQALPPLLGCQAQWEFSLLAGCEPMTFMCNLELFFFILAVLCLHCHAQA